MKIAIIVVGVLTLFQVLRIEFGLAGTDLVAALIIGGLAITTFVLLAFAQAESYRRMDIADTRWARSGRFKGVRRPAPRQKRD